MRTNGERSENRAAISNSTVAAAVFVAAVLASATSVAGESDSESGPVWLRERPPSTMALFKVSPERLGPTVEALADRVRPPNFRADRDFASVLIASSLVYGDVFETVFNPHGDLPDVSFEHLDRSRSIVYAASAAPSKPRIRRLRHGLPLLAEHIGEGELLVRAFFPARDADAFASELRSFCRRLTPNESCPRSVQMTARESWVRVEMPAPAEADVSADVGTADEPWRSSTPAMRMLLERDPGIGIYVPSSGIARFTSFVAANQVGRSARYARDADSRFAADQLRELPNEIAGAMVTGASDDPATREFDGFALAVDGADGSVRFDLAQSYTAYGAALAETGAAEVSVPSFELEQPVFSAAWTFDLPAVLEEVEAPFLMRAGFLGDREQKSRLRTLGRHAHPSMWVREVLTRPLTSLGAVIDAVKTLETPDFVHPEHYIQIAGGTVALRVQPEALERGDFRGAIAGGAALAFSDARAVGPFLNLIDLAQIATGLSVRASTARSGDHSILKLRFDSDDGFGETVVTGESTPRASFRGDWLLGLLDVLWARRSPDIVDEDDLYPVLDAIGDAHFEARSGEAGRVWTLRSGEHAVETVDLSAPDSGLPKPEALPECLERAVAASVRVYAIDVAELEARTRHRSRRRPSGGSTAEFSELDGDAIGEIEALVDGLEAQRTECADRGDRWAERVTRIRDYWKAVLDDEASTIPVSRSE